MKDNMSRESYEKLKEKIEALKKKRAVISKTIGEAREHGDLRENSAYHSAKDEQGLNEMRIKELEAKLDSVTVVENDRINKDAGVVIGSTVKVKEMSSGYESEYTIVPGHEADVLEGKISPESPLGDALLGQKEGKLVEIEVPAGRLKYKILEIK